MIGVIGVTGGTGGIGSRVAQRLADAGQAQRLIVRDPSRVVALPETEIATFEGYSDVAGMQTAFRGLRTLLLVSAREAEDRVQQHRQAIDSAVFAGVERVVYLSFIGAAAEATFTFARDHFLTEQHVRASGLAFTFSRQNLYLDLLPVIPGPDGVIRGPAGTGRLAPVSRDDVADALVSMLTQSDHLGMTYELTGPESLSMTEVAAQLTEFTGAQVRFHNETLDEAYRSRAAFNAPDWEVAGWISTYTAIAAGELNIVTDHVERLAGHKPMGVSEFLSRSALR